jgi:hypothetical protein
LLKDPRQVQLLLITHLSKHFSAMLYALSRMLSKLF